MLSGRIKPQDNQPYCEPFAKRWIDFEKRGIFALSSVVLIIFLTIPCVYGQNASKKEILAKYEKAVSLTEELNLYEKDALQVLPKIRLISKALFQDNLDQANRLLDEALNDLKLLEAKKPKGFKREIKKEWFEIYVDVAQKFILLAFLAYLFARWPFFGRMLKTDRFPARYKFSFAVFIIFLAIAVSFLDLSKYGESSWAFFDIQLVLVAIGGLLGGFWAGCFIGGIVGFLRWLLNPGFLIYAGIVLGAGLLNGLLSRQIRSYQRTGKISYLAGALTGAFHGAVVYLPASFWMPWYYVLFSIFLLAFLEGLGVFIFFSVVSVVLKEFHRQDMEQELLRSKLLVLQSQMRPHFLFNALSAISAVCHRENAPQARSLILHLAGFMRQTLKREQEMIALEEEIAYIDSYLEIEKVRLQDRLKIQKHFQISNEIWKAKIPLLILQPLVENAIQHGIAKKESGGSMTIKLMEESGILKIEIADNGVGMEPAFFERVLRMSGSTSEKPGIGIRNIQQRLVRLYGPSFGLQYESQLGKGTKVTVRIPITGTREAT